MKNLYYPNPQVHQRAGQPTLWLYTAQGPRATQPDDLLGSGDVGDLMRSTPAFTRIAGLPTWANGPYGQWLDCTSASGEVQSSVTTDLGTGPYAMAITLKTASVSGLFFAIDRTTGTLQLAQLFCNSGDLVFRIRGDDGVGLSNATASSYLTANTVYRIMGVRDGLGNIFLYGNGSLIATGVDSTTIGGSMTLILQIAAAAGGGSNWPGYLGDFRLFNYAPSATQAMRDYQDAMAPLRMVGVPLAVGASLGPIPPPSSPSVGGLMMMGVGA